jgi:toxin-antitoxin system PIN domain toxin
MIAVDTNVLAYAHRPEGPFHDRARKVMSALAEGRQQWAIPWPCVHEFLALVTNARVFIEPTPIGDALAQVEAWLASPSAMAIGERPQHFECLEAILVGSEVRGARVHDARIAAICQTHEVKTLLTADRDFKSMAGRIAVVNPFSELEK